jgi:plasmid stabilization system protein ParE
VRIVVAPLAAQDLQDAHDHIAKENPAAADALLMRVIDCLALLAAPTCRLCVHR